MTNRVLTIGLILLLTGCAEPENEVPIKLGAGTTFEIHTVCPAASETSKSAIDPMTGEEIFLVTPPIITAADVTSIKNIVPTTAEESNAVQFAVTAEGANRIAAATAQQKGRMAIVVNRKVISAPNILTQISSPFQVQGDSELLKQLTNPAPATEEPKP